MNNPKPLIEKSQALPPPTPKMIDQICFVCGRKFKGTVKIGICPTCYV